MKRITKAVWITAAAGAAVFICRKTKQIQKRAKEEGRQVPFGPYEAVLKRPLDVVVAALALVPLAPVMGLTALLVRVKLGSPVIFKQKRPGKDERIFTLYKFRTMTDERDENGELLADEKRLTGVGKFLRSTSLDELPELFNILKGDMSLVGPRPQLVRDMVFMSGEQRRRHEVRPGLTGLAQVMGRNAITWDDKFRWDLKYIEKISLWNDLRIIVMTAYKVFGANVNADELDVTLDYGDWLLSKQKINEKIYVNKHLEAKKLLE